MAALHNSLSVRTLSTTRPHRTPASPSRQGQLPRIAIVGGGPGGLTLGVLLQKQDIPFTIFELRPRPHTSEVSSATQGVLDLHEGEGGLPAIRACGLYDEFLNLTGECADVSTWADKDGNVLFSEKGGDGEAARPEISRNALNDLLVRNLGEGRVQWGMKLKSAEMLSSSSSSSKAVQLTFGKHDDKQPELFDLVIGADGAWSKIRSSLITPADIKPAYRDRQCITLTIPHITTRHPHLARLVGSGSWTALGDRHAVISQRGPQDSARLYLMLTKPGEENYPQTSRLAGMTPAQAKHALLHAPGALFADWAKQTRELVGAACDAEQETLDNGSDSSSSSSSGLLDIRPLYQLPDDAYPWPHNPCATLIGDAAHLTLPAGDGVNMAMCDALEVSKAIGQAWSEATVSHGQPEAAIFQHALAPHLAKFEKDMWARAEKGRAMANWLQDLMFGSEGSAKRVADVFSGKAESPFEQ